MASITSMPERTTDREREGGGERERVHSDTPMQARARERESFSGLGLLGSNSKIGAARGFRHFKNTCHVTSTLRYGD